MKVIVPAFLKGSDRLELEIPGKLDDLSKARQFASEFSSQNADGPLDDMDICQLELVVHEALADIIRHAYKIRRQLSMSNAPSKEGEVG